ncbi:MAG TPA: hypothetical protein VF534_27275 [Paraburkholderia sp.]
MGLIAADDMTEAQQAMLYEWTRSTVDSAFAAGHITQRWSPSDKNLATLRGYFDVGLTPEEAADALFAVKH